MQAEKKGRAFWLRAVWPNCRHEQSPQDGSESEGGNADGGTGMPRLASQREEGEGCSWGHSTAEGRLSVPKHASHQLEMHGEKNPLERDTGKPQDDIGYQGMRQADRKAENLPKEDTLSCGRQERQRPCLSVAATSFTAFSEGSRDRGTKLYIAARSWSHSGKKQYSE